MLDKEFIHSPLKTEHLPVILLELNPDSENEIKNSYTYSNGQIPMQYNGNHQADRYFYLHDRLGSVRELIDSTGAVVRLYTYNPFGELLETNESARRLFSLTSRHMHCLMPFKRQLRTQNFISLSLALKNSSVTIPDRVCLI